MPCIDDGLSCVRVYFWTLEGGQCLTIVLYWLDLLWLTILLIRWLQKLHWRTKHQNFIDTIKYAKKVAKVQSEGGSLSNLPPPPVTVNPDYVQCPHCQRRFNKNAADRHIPWCKDSKSHQPPKPKGRRQWERPSAVPLREEWQAEIGRNCRNCCVKGHGAMTLGDGWSCFKDNLI